MKLNVFVLDHIHEAGLQMLQNASDVNYQNFASVPKNELLAKISECEVAITRSSTDVDTAFLEAAPKLRAVVRAGVGVDNVDIESASKRGVVVMNVPTANTIAAVELTCAHILSCVRNYPSANHQLKNGRLWKREDWYGTELKGKKIGVIGFGNIGSRVATRMKAFEAEVITFDPYISPAKATDLGIAYTTNFDDILACDIITIHTPKNKETINIIDAEEIAKCKDGVILINVARGGLYNEEALYNALKSGKVRWAGIDVFSKEPGTTSKLLDLPNAYFTPHIGANTLESQEKISEQAAQAALEAARGSSFPNALNLPIKENELPSFLRPYLELAQKLGYFAQQCDKSAVRGLKIEGFGAVRDYLDSLATFALVGVLNASIGERVNYVNAPFVANEQGIKLEKIARDSSSTFKNKIKITLLTQNGEFEVSGTVFSEVKPRIVEINGFKLDFAPRGRMILYKNNDKPGVIGFIGSTLAKHNINIADFRLGRAEQSALAVILLDEEPSDSVLDELKAQENCISLKYVVM